MARVIDSVPGRVGKPVDLQRSLKIDLKLCWKAFKVARASGPLAAGTHVPGTASMKTFLRAAQRRGVPGPIIDEVANAEAEFRRMISTHAGDRATFDSMASALARGEDRGQIDLQHRRAAFRANGHIWGVQAGTRFRCDLLQPAEDPNKLDFASFEGYVNLRQLRREAPIVLSVTHSGDDQGGTHQIPWEPIDPEGTTPQGKALIREFCSQPLPQLSTVNLGGGFVQTEMVSNGVGNQAAITCIDGWLGRGFLSRYRDEQNRVAEHGVRIHIPCEVLVLDVLVKEGTFGPMTPVAVAYGDLLNMLPGRRRPHARDRLPFDDPVVYLGTGPAVLHTPEVPRYPEIAQYVFDRLDWNGAHFDVFRCTVAYPAMPSTVWIRYDLPDPPTG